MSVQSQPVLFPDLSSQDDWTFASAQTRELTHCYHDYPARMIPQVAGKLMDIFGKDASLLFDPYCGSGTSLVEASLRGIPAVGTDLNPLARLIAQAKISLPDLPRLRETITSFHRQALEERIRALGEPKEIYGIPNLFFWFKPEVVEKLSRIKTFIESIEDAQIRLFFQVAFSETVRESSNTRNNEFKLYRMPEEKLANFHPDVYGMMAKKLQRNLRGYEEYRDRIENAGYLPKVSIYGFNTVEGIPAEILPPRSVDLVVTSPPYGDSGTTVAYGQYSRLSAAWLGLEEPHKIDRKLMGARKAVEISRFPSDALNEAIARIARVDEKRARHVSSFYADLQNSIFHVSETIQRGGYACYVVGNRRVKEVELPTDSAISAFFEARGFSHVETFSRTIPNKRMPRKNSPTNQAGMLSKTMTREYIVVMRREEP